MVQGLIGPRVTLLHDFLDCVVCSLALLLVLFTTHFLANSVSTCLGGFDGGGFHLLEIVESGGRGLSFARRVYYLLLLVRSLHHLP